MPLNIASFTAVSTLLLSLADASLFREDGARLLQAESTANWPSLSITVTSNVQYFPDANYTMKAEPVFSDGSKKVLYNVDARFDSDHYSGLPNWLISYKLIDGKAVATSTSNQRVTTECLTSESDDHTYPPLNAIFHGLMNENGQVIENFTNKCPKAHTFTISGVTYSVCRASSGRVLTIRGDNTELVVHFVKSVDISSDGGAASKCQRVVEPMNVTKFGASFLNPPM